MTGGATGIGFAAAKALLEHGSRVVIAQRDAHRGQQAVDQLKTADCTSVCLDIQDRSAVVRCVSAIVERYGMIDLLVNNASVTGQAALASFTQSGPELINQIIDTNLKGTIYCSQEAARHMVDRGKGGSIVHVSSVGAYAAQENASIYCATKAAQIMLTKAMALELADYGIRVNCIAPGDIKTETSAAAIDDVMKSGASGRFLRSTPLARRGNPEEVGRVIAFLASDDASFVSGVTVVVDGGYLTY